MGHVSATTKLSLRKRDRYNTPEAATRVLLSRVTIKGTVVEPCSGTRQISKVLETERYDLNSKDGRLVITNDIDKRFTADFHMDMLDPEFWKRVRELFGQPDWVITNPPFNQAPALVPLAYQEAKIGIAFFLRLSFLEPCDDRAEFLSSHVLNRQIVLPRISFKTVRTEHADGRVTVSKTDNMTCAWFVWRKDVQAPGGIEIVTKEQLKAFEELKK